MFFDRYEKLCKEIRKSPTGVAIELDIGRATVSYWRNGNTPKNEILNKIADYFDVTVDYLIGNTNERRPINKDISEDDIKFALWGGDSDEVDEEMLEDVYEYAKMKMKLKKRKKE